LPTAWYLPFHPDAGIQTSTLMSESGDGFSVAATRQKAGRLLYPWSAAPVVGGLNPPAGTVWAKVIVVFGSVDDDKPSQDAVALPV
jgi:hypothetical protein